MMQVMPAWRRQIDILSQIYERDMNLEEKNGLKNSIKSYSYYSKCGKYIPILLETLNIKAHRILKKLSMHHGVTLSDVIIEYMEKAFWELPDVED